MRGLLEENGKTFLTDYKKLVDENHGVNQCVNCGACAKLCPQHINIPEMLKEAHNSLI
jgi:predicted aldo/keto reductase-like oxidoreductase